MYIVQFTSSNMLVRLLRKNTGLCGRIPNIKWWMPFEENSSKALSMYNRHAVLGKVMVVIYVWVMNKMDMVSTDDVHTVV